MTRRVVWPCIRCAHKANGTDDNWEGQQRIADETRQCMRRAIAAQIGLVEWLTEKTAKGRLAAFEEARGNEFVEFCLKIGRRGEREKTRVVCGQLRPVLSRSVRF